MMSLCRTTARSAAIAQCTQYLPSHSVLAAQQRINAAESAHCGGLQVAKLRQLVAGQLQLPADRLRLVHKGSTLWDGRDAPTLTDAGAECQMDGSQ
jgi:hypothetical protein